jgi:putative redox protein
LLLAAVGGCSGMDVVFLLAKMKIVPDDFSMEITEKVTETHPEVYEKIQIAYSFEGENLPR